MALSHLYRGVAVQRQALQRWQLLVTGGVRSCSGAKKELTASSTAEDSSSGASDSGRGGRPGLTDHRINRLERYLLVWGGKYKTLAEVPDLVSQDTLERARNKARIKINLMMCAATLFGCLAMIYMGKKARAAGESVVKINMDWHKKVNEEYQLSKDEKNE